MWFVKQQLVSLFVALTLVSSSTKSVYSLLREEHHSEGGFSQQRTKKEAGITKKRNLRLSKVPRRKTVSRKKNIFASLEPDSSLLSNNIFALRKSTKSSKSDTSSDHSDDTDTTETSEDSTSIDNGGDFGGGSGGFGTYVNLFALIYGQCGQTSHPSLRPTSSPSRSPSVKPSTVPSSSPSSQPSTTMFPSTEPSI